MSDDSPKVITPLPTTITTAATTTTTTTPPSPTYPSPIVISPHITLQAPLSRRGRGPGLILVLDHYARLEKSHKYLDPLPLQKWAEEGFCVVQLLVPGKVEDGGEFALERAVEILEGCEGCEMEGGVGVISYLFRIPFYVSEALHLHPKIKAIVSYGGKKFSSLNDNTTTVTHAAPHQLIHSAGPSPQRRESYSSLPTTSSTPSDSNIKEHRYIDATHEANWMLPSDDAYHKTSAGLAHTRSLAFLKQHLNGPWFDLEAVWEEHCRYEFGERDVDKTMATMVEEPYVNHIPTMTGGIGKPALTSFYTHHFIFSNPTDTSLTLLSRTIGASHVIDEFIFSLTHSSEIPWLLPGIPPTHKRLEIPFTSIVAMRGDRLCHEHISWDQGTVLRQLGLLPEWMPFPYPIEGKEAPEGKRFEVRVPVVGVEGTRKLTDEGAEESNLLMEGKWRIVDDV